MKKRILIVNDQMDIGGNSVALISLLNAIDKNLYQIDLLLYKNRGALLSEVPEGVHLLPQAAQHQKRFGILIRLLLLLFSGYGVRALLINYKQGYKGFSKQIMWDFQADILSSSPDCQYDCAISFFEGWADRYVAKKVQAKKKIGWLHSTFRKIAPIPALEQGWMTRVDHIACVADECKSDFCAVLPEYAYKTTVIENVRDSTRIKQLSKIEDSTDEFFERFKNTKCFKIVTVCRLEMETKGLDRAIYCAAQMKKSGCKFLWCVVGDGNDRERLQKAIRDQNISDCFILAGSRLNPYPFIRVSDVMCLPSRWEGKPLTVYESMILGIPPVVTEYISVHEQIRNGNEGFIVKNDDDSIYPILTALAKIPEKLLEVRNYLSKHEYGDLSPVNDLYLLMNGTFERKAH